MQNDIHKVRQVYYHFNGGMGSEVEWWGWGIIKGSFQKKLKQGWVKAKVVRRGRGLLRCHHPCPPKDFSRTLGLFFRKMSNLPDK